MRRQRRTPSVGQNGTRSVGAQNAFRGAQHAVYSARNAFCGARSVLWGAERVLWCAEQGFDSSCDALENLILRPWEAPALGNSLKHSPESRNRTIDAK